MRIYKLRYLIIEDVKFSVGIHLRSTKDLKRASGHLSPPTNNVRDLKSVLLSWKTCILVHLNA